MKTTKNINIKCYQHGAPPRSAKALTTLAALVMASFTHGADIAKWDFFGENTLATSTAEIIDANIVSPVTLTRGGGAAASAGNNSFRTVGFQNNGIATTNTDYFQTTLAPSAGFTLSLSTIDATMAGTTSFSASPGTTNQFAYSLDGTTFTLIGSPLTRIGNGALTQIDVSAVSALQNVSSATTITLRFYASGQTTSGGWGFTSGASGVYGLAIGGSVSTAGADTTPPTLASTAPADNVTGVLTNANLVATFSETVQKGTSGNVIIKKTSDNSVAETIDITTAAVTVAGAVVTIDPSVTLDNNTEYYVTIDANAFKDNATVPNNYAGLSSTTAWSFTTVAADTTAPTLSPTIPADDATAILINANLVGTFSESVQKGTGNIVIKLTSDDSTVQTIDVTNAAVTIAGAVVTIDPPSDLVGSTGYYVTIDDGAIKDLASTPNNYTGLTNKTLWNFTTAVLDNTAPTLTPTIPADDATAIALNTNLVGTFSESVQKGTGNILIKLTADDSTVQTIDVTTAAVTIAGAVVTIDPPSDLANDIGYYVTIDAGAIKDLASTPNNYAGLTVKNLWNFTTVGDITAPTLTPTTPADNSNAIAIDTNIVGTFSESVQKGIGNIVIKKTSDDSTVQTIDVTNAAVTIVGAVVTIDPPSDLANGTGYYVTIDAGAIKDIAGTPNNYAGLVDKTLWNFTTVPAAITPGQVVISQVYGGGGNTGAPYTNDFIELHNNSNATVNITGWSVQYAPSGGPFGNKTDLFGSIPAGGYFLVQGAAGINSPAALPTPDIIGTLGLGATSGKVALVGNTTSLGTGGPSGAPISDFVGYGSAANLFEGAASTPAPSNTLAVVRQNSGTLDTNVNSFDFVTAAPAPRNSATPAYTPPIDGSGVATLANVTPASPLLNSPVFGSNLATQTVAITLTGTFPNSTLTDITVDVPAAFTGLDIGNVTLTGTGTPSVIGNTITISGAALTTANTLIVTISGMQSPNTFTPVDLTNDGNYAFTIATKQSGGTLSPLSASPKAYVVIPITNIRDQDTNGVPLDLNDKVAVQGVCTEGDFDASINRTSAYLQEVSGSGVNIFSASNESPYVRGNEYVTFGNVIQFNGLSEVSFTSLAASVFNLGVAATQPTPITLTLATLMAAPENYEGKLLTIVGLTNTSAVTWAPATSIPVTDDASTTILDIYLQSGSTATTSPFYPAAITGVFGQFDNLAPALLQGYQLQPRDASDIVSSGLSPYQTWATGAPYNLTGNDALFNADPDKDGTSNGIEFIVGSSPTVANDANDFIPKVTITGAPGARVATIVYRRTDASSYLNPVLQTSPDLLTWSEPIEGFNGASIVVDNDFYGTSPGIDKVTVTLDANGPRGFVRLIATSYP